MKPYISQIIVAASSFAVLALLAAFHSPRLDDDSYSHYCVSVETMAHVDCRSFVTDTWNKPLTSLAYGVTGQLGLFPARLVSVLLSVLAAFLVYQFAVAIFACEGQLHPVTAAAFFLCQVAVFTQAFLTMTELLAAVLLAIGLWCFQRNRPVCAFAAIGLMPLARVESCLVMGWIFFAVSLYRLRKDGFTLACIVRLAGWNLAGIVPFATWWIAGWLYTGKIAWLSSDYCYLRPFTLTGVLSVNAFTGLPAVLSAPLLVLLVIGLLRLPAIVKTGRQSHYDWPVMSVVYGGMLVHFVFLSLFVVYPRGSGYGDLAISALNPRNYNSIAPLMAVFIFGGALSLSRMCDKIAARSEWKWGLAGFALAQIAVIGFFFFRSYFSFSPSRFLCVIRLILQSSLLLGFGVVLLFSWWRIRKQEDTSKCARGMVICMAVYCMFCLPMTDPVFWYPLRFNDRKVVAQEKFGQWFRNNITNQKTLVVQDMNGRLDMFCNNAGARFVWMYPGLFSKTLEHAESGSLVLLETDIAGTLLDRYPKALIDDLRSTRYKLRKEHVDKTPLAGWEQLIHKITSRNDPVGWLVYEKVR